MPSSSEPGGSVCRFRALKSAVAVYKHADDNSSVASGSTSAIDIDKMKKELSKLQEALMEAPDGERKAIQSKVKELKKWVLCQQPPSA